MNLKSKLCYSGILLFPLSLAVIVWGIRDFGLEVENPLAVIFIALLPTLYSYSINSMTYSNGKRKYGLLDAFNWRTDPYAVHSGKNRAMRPEVNEKLLSKNPKGIVIGKFKGRYVVNDPMEGGAHHSLILGSSGCGKTSSVILPSVLVKGCTRFVVDIKGEISEKGEYLDDPDVRIINPLDRRSYGYDSLYRLKSDATEQDIIDTLNNIMFSIMPINASDKNPFWGESTRNMFMGFGLFYVKNGIRNFIELTDEILQKPIKEAVEAVMNEADVNSPEYRYLVKFSDMADETLSGVYGQLSNALTLFSNDMNVRHMLGDNPLKINPKALNDGKSIYLVIPEEKLSQYAPVLHLVINQVISEMELRNETSAPVMMIIDELARITSTGKIHKLTDGLATLRSRNVSLVLVSQSIEALENAYTKAEVSALVTNMPYKIILEASSSSTQRDIIGWCGKYREYKETFGKNGKGTSRSTTYEEKDIVNAADLMALPTTGEAILISPYGYNRIRKCPYFKDKILKKKAVEIKTHNDKLKKIGG